MEIERKFLIDESKINYKEYPHKSLEQAYLCTSPVIRVRKEDDTYYMTYKGKGMMTREEYNLPLNKEAYESLKEKREGNLISKTRYLIPFKNYTIELDDFASPKPLLMAEVEFPTEEEANSFVGPEWFVEDVTGDPKYHNSNMI